MSIVLNPADAIAVFENGLSSIFERENKGVFLPSPVGFEDNLLKQLMILSEAKKEVSFMFHVNAFTTNEVLEELFDCLVWGGDAGSISTSVSVIPLSKLGKHKRHKKFESNSKNVSQ